MTQHIEQAFKFSRALHQGEYLSASYVGCLADFNQHRMWVAGVNQDMSVSGKECSCLPPPAAAH